MASSKTVFRPRWVSAEHSRYFTESEKEQQGSEDLSHGEASVSPQIGGIAKWECHPSGEQPLCTSTSSCRTQ